MPHISYHITKDCQIDKPKLLDTTYQMLLDTGVFRGSDIKIRLFTPEYHQVFDGTSCQAHIFVQIALMAGRDDATKKRLCQAVTQAVKDAMLDDTQVIECCVDVVDLSSVYTKTVLGTWLFFI